MSSAAAMKKHPVEDEDSWSLHLERRGLSDGPAPGRRILKHKKNHHEGGMKPKELEQLKEAEFQERKRELEKFAEKKLKKKLLKRKKKMEELYSNPGIQQDTTHGIVIDAGSGGSRLHIYEFAPRVLRTSEDVQEAVSGRLLSFPGSESRWTDRLSPGISTFYTIEEPDELEKAIADYLEPLMDFAKKVLHEKQSDFQKFPIYLRATAGMRTLTSENRARIMGAVRKLFANEAYCPFYFEDEQARTLSGEEEAIFDWLGVNFLSSNGGILQDSQGAGTVSNPRQTFGALDLGGASTQIAFYEPDEDIMANLFKLQVGQGKHWNVYTHSFLFYGMNEATNRFDAGLADGHSAEERLVKGLHNPCLPGGSTKEIRTNIHVHDGMETWQHDAGNDSVADGFYQAVLKNDDKTNDFENCNALVQKLLHMESNKWCNFDHRGDCSFAGIYQPKLPAQSENFGEFMAFSNYAHIWNFLDLPDRASIGQLENATKHACSMSKEETLAFNNGRVEEELVEQFCFRSVYALNLLRGFGFQDDQHINAVRVVNGHKVGWAIGSMLYEINTMPWHYDKPDPMPSISFDGFDYRSKKFNWAKWELFGVFMLMSFAGLLYRARRRNARLYEEYEPVKDVNMDV